MVARMNKTLQSDKFQEHLRSHVQKEFKKRCGKNDAYSWRAFSIFLGIDQSYLSKMIKGNRKISKRIVAILQEKLGLRFSDTEVIVENKSTYVDLSESEFAAICEWYHFAIIELIKIPGHAINASFIAKRLGIDEELATNALGRLRDRGLIRMTSGRWYVNSDGNSWTNNFSTSESRKLLQKTFLEKSITALENVPFEHRDHGSLTVSVSRSQIPALKEKMRQIRQDLGKSIQDAAGKPDEVYQLTISFFPLTNISEELR